MTQMDFNFDGGAGAPAQPAQPLRDRSLDLIGGTPDDVALVLHNDATARGSTELDATFSVMDGVDKRVRFVRDVEHGRCQIVFGGLLQTVIRQFVRRDGESPR